MYIEELSDENSAPLRPCASVRLTTCKWSGKGSFANLSINLVLYRLNDRFFYTPVL
jgi:hypothetical protein